MVASSSQWQHSGPARLAAFRTMEPNPTLTRESKYSLQIACELGYRSARTAKSWHSINEILRTHSRMEVEMQVLQLAPSRNSVSAAPITNVLRLVTNGSL